ncbi:MAG: glycoside hydrolase family 38 C-terminal domain-containing protein [Christensenellales bacterium]|jgi:alpha-mannosidase
MEKFKTRKDKELNWIAYQNVNMLKHLRYAHRIFSSIKKRIYTPLTPLCAEVVKSEEPIPFNELKNYTFEPVSTGEKWGRFFDCAWFRFKGRIPEGMNGKHIAAIIDIQGEGLVTDSKGEPIKGLTRVLSVSDAMNTVAGKKIYDITDNSEGGSEINFFVEAGNNGFLMKNVGASKLKKAMLVIVNDKLYDLYFDFLTLYTYMITLKRDNRRYKEIKSSMDKAGALLKRYSDDEIVRARDILKIELLKDSDSEFEFYCTGHAHLDLAWMWPIRETKRKAVRTFANQLDLIEKNPEYIYCASQPQMYKWVKELQPGLYNRVQSAVKDGNIEPVGGMWVEPDCNVPSGESLVRQFLLGKRFFLKEFDKDMKILFLPDVFGFNGNLPQIMKKCGVEYFLTTKMSWNEYNAFPYHSYVWEGIDGSAVLAHMPPSGNYNADLTAYMIEKTYSVYKEKFTGIAGMLFGAGDGGGGPSEVQVEMLTRQKSLDGMKKLKPSSQIDFFLELSKQRDKLPVYKGELYLEKHNGTYTTQAKTKYYNRKIENMLHDTELLAAIAYVTKNYPYPHEKINSIWEEMLLYQFHDILPGSSITRVYNECNQRYAEMLKMLESLQSELFKALSEGDGLSVINTTSFARNEWVSHNNTWYKAEIKPYSSQELKAGKADAVSYDESGIYSDKLSVKFNDEGIIISIVDKESGKEFAGGEMNRLSVYKDKKLFFNAWDIDPGYINKQKGKFKLMGVNTYVDGPKVIRRQFMLFNKSAITQEIILTESCPYLEFKTKVNWQEDKLMLRADFKPSVFAPEATSNIQFGNIRRSTSTADRKGYASYEICAHKWVDVSADGYGISLINDCKYGHRVKDGLISLNLLRSTVYPDKTADRGEHTFNYAIYPHKGSVEDSDAVMLGYAFNNPLAPVEMKFNIDEFAATDNADIVIETVKKAEDSDAIIVRLYESKGRAGKASLRTALKDYTAYEADMLENIIKEISVDNLEFTPYEIKSIMFVKVEKIDKAPAEIATVIEKAESKSQEKSKDIEQIALDIVPKDKTADEAPKATDKIKAKPDLKPAPKAEKVEKPATKAAEKADNKVVKPEPKVTGNADNAAKAAPKDNKGAKPAPKANTKADNKSKPAPKK